ncbi:conserved hypothetical protein [Ricinus communis]|uniref:Uncharacterized protein n=1 Tax=Ricinus communis TaxID=3988 RepID=B9S6Z1_RICCO|nr:conserved hypothetical protein [Ricinus communis]
MAELKQLAELNYHFPEVMECAAENIMSLEDAYQGTMTIDAMIFAAVSVEEVSASYLARNIIAIVTASSSTASFM